MPKSVQKIALSRSADIPFDKLVLSQSNVRRVKAGVAIEELAEDIARRTLIQSLSVRPVLDEAGEATGIYEVPAGGRRFRALELLVKQKRLAKDAPIPCVIRNSGIAEEDSLAENVQRAPLHPLDQFRAFQAMRDKGLGEETIAAAFFVTPAVVKQRLRLASVSPRLLEAYADDAMTLDQLMAFTVATDHARQEQVWEAVQRGYSREAYTIRRMLTEDTVRASDKRALFVGLDSYVEAGGAIMRDLFQPDDGGWLQDPALLDLLVGEKLREEKEAIEAEGWRWVEAAVDMPYGRQFGMRRLCGERRTLSDDEEARREALIEELAAIEADYMDHDMPDEVAERCEAISAELEPLDNPPTTWTPEDTAIAGVFVSVDGSGRLRVERGYVRPEDEPAVEPEAEEVTAEADQPIAVATSTEVAAATDEPGEDEGLRPLPDRLVTELTSYRTVALREALGRNPEVAFLAALHALCLRVFYHYGQDSCIELDLKSVVMTAPGLADTAAATAISARHPILAHHLPTDPAELWDTLVGFNADLLGRLFAHCIAQGVNAVLEPWNRRPRAIAHADRLATAVGLDMAAHWQPTAENFFGRVTKARIAEAVQEAKGQAAAEAIAGLKKDAMAERAEELLAGSGWLPEPLRTPGVSREPNASEGSVAIDSEPAMEPDVDIADTEALTSGGFAEAAE
jgi:ParB family chromosome partitioning protein